MSETMPASIATYVDYTPDPATNRLSSASYNGRGAMRSYQSSNYTWDGFDNLASVTGSEIWTHAYDANNERTWSWRTSPQPRLDTYSLRGPGGQLLREYKKQDTLFTWEDYVYREGQLLASVDSNNVTRHLHLDHLGTVRRTTDTNGTLGEPHNVWPYGEEYTTVSDGQQMKFTGHERDLGVLSSSADDLDYMHARHYRPLLGRFLSADPVGGELLQPKTFNRYAYSLNNPVRFVDREGAEVRFAIYDPAFLDAVVTAMARIEGEHPRIAQVITGLKESTHLHVIEQRSGGAGNYHLGPDANLTNGIGADTITYLSTNIRGENDELQTLEEALAHELSHAEDKDTGTQNASRVCADCAEAHEVKAVQMQNLVRQAVPRNTYDGKKVPNPEAVPKNPRKKSPTVKVAPEKPEKERS